LVIINKPSFGLSAEESDCVLCLRAHRDSYKVYILLDLVCASLHGIERRVRAVKLKGQGTQGSRNRVVNQIESNRHLRKYKFLR
jgi:hypothetical protein